MPEPEGGTEGAAGAGAAGASPAPGAGAPGEREKYIPRERFDEVNDQVQSLKQQVAYLSAERTQPGAVEGGEQKPAQQGDGIPQDYRTWEDWHANDPGAAIDWRSRQAYHQERQKTEFVSGRQKFLDEVYTEKPEWRDPVKRANDPTYQAFTRLLSENPASAASYAGLKQLHKLAKVESGAHKDEAAAAREAGALSEQQRQAAAAAGYSPAGTGSPAGGGGAQAPQLSPGQKRIANRFGMSEKEYADRNADGPQKIPMKYEKAKRG